MKKLILLELILLFLATTFQSDNPPGWYQQTLPVNDFVEDIFFLDSLSGWLVTRSTGASNDTGYIMKTSNGGTNWNIQYSGAGIAFRSLQLVNYNLGYAVAGSGSGGKILKTTNGGNYWFIISSLETSPVLDLSFVNQDTGWLCGNSGLDGGVFKTTDGGNSWVRQLNEIYGPQRIYFLNKDTGWFTSSFHSNNLYRTINGGVNWSLFYVFPGGIFDVEFWNKDLGWITSGVNYKTTNAGINWIPSETSVTGIKLSFISDSVGWAGINFNIISKTVDGGTSWYYQNSPIFDNSSVSATDSLNAWAGGFGIVQTTDGGGTTTLSNEGNSIPEKFILYQNYPNPFNPVTVISYQLSVSSFINLKVYNVLGNEVTTIVNQKQNAGEYKVEFDGTGLNSGVYFYKLVADSFGEMFNENRNPAFSVTRKMILIR